MHQLTILSENTVRGAGLLGEHGLAYWLDTGTHRVLFDTGQGLALQHNATKLGIDLGRVDAIVLSHGHYDHVSGLPAALQAAPGAENQRFRGCGRAFLSGSIVREARSHRR